MGHIEDPRTNLEVFQKFDFFVREFTALLVFKQVDVIPNHARNMLLDDMFGVDAVGDAAHGGGRAGDKVVEDHLVVGELSLVEILRPVD